MTNERSGSSTPLSVWVAGGTGLVGRELLALLARQPVSITAWVRKTPKDIPGPIDWRVTDFSSFNPLAPHPDVALCALGTTLKAAGSRSQFQKVDHDYVVKFAKEALSRGARRFVLVSAVGAHSQSPWFYNRVKGLLEQDLTAQEWPSLVLLHPSMLLGSRKTLKQAPRWGESLAQPLFKMSASFFKGPLARFKPVTAQAVATEMVRWAVRPVDLTVPSVVTVESHQMGL